MHFVICNIIFIIAFQELLNQVTELQKCSGEHSTSYESDIISLKTVVQEKDDMITDLKSELNNNIEKVTQLIEDNKYLNEQMLLKEEQAKGHADDVIKELGEVSMAPIEITKPYEIWIAIIMFNNILKMDKFKYKIKYCMKS